MRKFVVYFLTPGISILLICLKIPAIETKLEAIHPNADGIIACLIIAGTLFSYFISIWSPYADWLKIRKKIWAKMNDSADELRKDYKNIHDLSINIMVPQKKLLFFIEPKEQRNTKKKLTLYGTVLKTIWNYGPHHVPTKLRFTAKQGACGKAFTSEEIKGVAITEKYPYDTYNFNFTVEQENFTSLVRIIVSCPIIIKEDGPFEQKVKVIGVLNIESRLIGSEYLIENQNEYGKFCEKVKKLASIYSKLI